MTDWRISHFISARRNHRMKTTWWATIVRLHQTCHFVWGTFGKIKAGILGIFYFTGFRIKGQIDLLNPYQAIANSGSNSDGRNIRNILTSHLGAENVEDGSTNVDESLVKGEPIKRRVPRLFSWRTWRLPLSWVNDSLKKSSVSYCPIPEYILGLKTAHRIVTA